ncbi:MAG: hypothetical protein WKF75_04450, partial [Singulisphaera sp.]
PLTDAKLEVLKKATATSQRRNDLHKQIAQAFEPLIRDGLLGPNPLPRHEDSSRTFSVHALGQDPAEAHLVPRDRVAPERVGKPEGPVYREFVAAFTSPEIGPVLFGLVAGKLTGTPTLAYEERYTTQQREKARASVEDVFDTYRRGDVLVEQDQEILEEQVILLRLEHAAANARSPSAPRPAGSDR